MQHPFQAISPDRVGRYLIPLSLLTIVFMITLNWLSTPLNNPSAPSGIISFELAGEVETAKAIIASWDVKNLLIASLSLGLDYLFLVIYSAAIGMGCIWASKAFSARATFLISSGVFLAWAQWFAALFDGVENAALIKMLLGNIQSPWPQIARTFAIMKFALIALGLVFIMVGALFKLVKQSRPDSSLP
jgi:hypothetical protein